MYGILFGASFLVSLILLAFLYNVRHLVIAKILINITILMAFWLLMETLSYYVQAEAPALHMQKAKYISITFIPPLFYLVAREYINKKTTSLLSFVLPFTVPCLSLLALFTNKIPYRFFSDAYVTYEDHIPVFFYKANIGFTLHTVYSYIIIGLGCWIFLMHAIRSPKLYRKQSIFIFIGSAVSYAINFSTIILRTGPIDIDVTSISMLVTIIIVYWGIFRLPQEVVIPIARELLVENLTDIAIIADSSDKIIDINPAGINFLSKHGVNLKQHNFIGVSIQEVMGTLANLRMSDTKADEPGEGTLIFAAEDQTIYFRMVQAPIYDTDKRPIGKLFMLHNITQTQQYMNHLQHLNEQLVISDRILSTAMEGILITDATGTITKVNSAFEQMSGYSSEELTGQNPRVLKSGRHEAPFYTDMWNHLLHDGYWEGEIWDRRKDGELYPKWMTITSLKRPEGIVEHYIAICTDISKIKKAEEALHKLAYYDSLTNVPNRTLFYERLEMAIIRAKDNQKAVALLFMDLDNFKVVNDTLGHAAGDSLLKEVASRIKACIRKSDTVSRLGGDEFTVILENIEDLEYVKNMAEVIIQAISLPYTIMDRDIKLGVSIGIALAPNDETTVEGLVRKVDAAMYDAKARGKGRYSFSSEEIERRNHEILDMQIKLSTALIHNEFQLYLQPQISWIEDRFCITGAEALIRWKTVDGKVFTPDKFIPMSENNGMIIPIGNWVLEEIFRIHEKLCRHGIHIKLAINISSKQFENNQLIITLKELLAKHDANGIDLVFEITESFLLKDLDQAIRSLQEIRILGIGIALDDFGTGFSSLSYLTRLPIDYLKIDKSFIDDIAIPGQKNLTPIILSMAKTLGLTTVAEGVETPEQIQRLLAENCDQLQGYYFSRPVDVDSFIQYAGKEVACTLTGPTRTAP